MKMIEDEEKEICINCGELIYKEYKLPLDRLRKLREQDREKWVEYLCKEGGFERDRAENYIDHKMGFNCQKSEPPCPKCGTPLKTWHAIICLKCDWKRDESKPLTTYYKNA